MAVPNGLAGLWKVYVEPLFARLLPKKVAEAVVTPICEAPGLPPPVVAETAKEVAA